MMKREHEDPQAKSIVYFTSAITPEGLLAVYEALPRKAKGKVGVKISSGEPGGHNFLKPSLIKTLVDHVQGTILECNTAYGTARRTSAAHWDVMRDHGFLAMAPCDLLDEDKPDLVLPIPEGRHLKEDYVGNHLSRYDFIVNLAHFKGHAMGGFGGVLKNQSIGFGSSEGKMWIHSAGRTTEKWIDTPQDDFLESMAEAATAVARYEGDRIVYIDIMNRLSVDCDCDSNPEEPKMADIGIASSLDPVALDQFAVDSVYASSDPGKSALIERMETRHAQVTLAHAEDLGLGSRSYRVVTL